MDLTRLDKKFSACMTDLEEAGRRLEIGGPLRGGWRRRRQGALEDDLEREAKARKESVRMMGGEGTEEVWSVAVVTAARYMGTRVVMLG